ncbi:unnamed protein product [Brachionus calyciflorus]|uniref:Uncharacterized protein n=1 Tax=Brachionus calyciflorus TaxID=104777 RepID=A0A814K7Z1_9BILA|nr:unnamed protein product [Brachionus calyciflorus]
MIQDKKLSNVHKESIYGWFPAPVEDSPKRSPIDIYMNLGSRHPKEESFLETHVLNQCVKEIHAENFKKESHDPDKTVNPPWALSTMPTPNIPDEFAQQQMLNRSKSAPVMKYWKPKKKPLQIPKPELYNLFNGEAKHMYFSSNNIEIKKKPVEKKVMSVSKIDCEEIGDATIEIISPGFLEAQNYGKKPILTSHESNMENNIKNRNKLRPKTAVPFSGSKQGVPLSQINRSQTTLTMRKTPEIKDDVIEKTEQVIIQEEAPKIVRKSSAKSNKILMENWKSNLLEREKFLNPRPNYYVKIDLDKLKPDRPAPEVHYNAAETYFYNTMPFRKATFTINPHFISENLNVQKIDLKLRENSARGSSMEPVRYRRDYAFVY